MVAVLSDLAYIWCPLCRRHTRPGLLKSLNLQSLCKVLSSGRGCYAYGLVRSLCGARVSRVTEALTDDDWQHTAAASVRIPMRQASEESGTPPVAGAAQHGSAGMSRRGAAAAMARTRGGGDHRPKRDRRRRTRGLGEVWNGGGFTFPNSEALIPFRGVSVQRTSAALIVSLVECECRVVP